MLPLNPPSDRWEDDLKYQFILNVLMTITRDISKRGEKTHYIAELDMMYEYIEEHLDKYKDDGDEYVD